MSTPTGYRVFHDEQQAPDPVPAYNPSNGHPPQYQYYPTQPQPQPQPQHAIPIQGYPSSPVPVAQPVVAIPIGGTSHVEPARYSTTWKLLIGFSFVLLIIVLLLRIMVSTMTDTSYVNNELWILYFSVLIIVLLISWGFRFPTRLEFGSQCVIMHTRFSTHSLAYERICSIEVVPTVACSCVAGCSFPKGAFTAFHDGLFIRSPDCGQSIAFTPTDMQRVLTFLRTTSLHNRILVVQ